MQQLINNLGNPPDNGNPQLQGTTDQLYDSRDSSGIYQSSQYAPDPQQAQKVANNKSRTQRKEGLKPAPYNPAPTPEQLGVPRQGAPPGPFGSNEAPTPDDRPNYGNPTTMGGHIFEILNGIIHSRPPRSGLPGGGFPRPGGGGRIPVPWGGGGWFIK